MKGEAGGPGDQDCECNVMHNARADGTGGGRVERVRRTHYTRLLQCFTPSDC